jgi:hypothetical protein
MIWPSRLNVDALPWFFAIALTASLVACSGRSAVSATGSSGSGSPDGAPSTGPRGCGQGTSCTLGNDLAAPDAARGKTPSQSNQVKSSSSERDVHGDRMLLPGRERALPVEGSWLLAEQHVHGGHPRRAGVVCRMRRGDRATASEETHALIFRSRTSY